jgi:hypothetical protein
MNLPYLVGIAVLVVIPMTTALFPVQVLYLALQLTVTYMTVYLLVENLQLVMTIYIVGITLVVLG